MEYQSILIKKSDRIGWVVLNRPEKLNVLTRAAVSELRDAFGDLEQDPEVGVVILTGSGDRAFTAGVDISEFSGMGMQAGLEYAAEGQALALTIESSKKPVIAALTGLVVGGGLELALACHLRLASGTAKFSLPEVKLGLIPGFGGTQRLPRLVGRGRALELILTGRTIDVHEALSWGLINRVVPVADLDAASRSLAREILANAPRSLEYAIQALIGGLDRSLPEGLALEAEYFGRACLTEDQREGVKAFLEKRRPDFKGR
jgi:enoyl-CoA hydratase